VVLSDGGQKARFADVLELIEAARNRADRLDDEPPLFSLAGGRTFTRGDGCATFDAKHVCAECDKKGSGRMPYWECNNCRAVFCNNCKASKSLASTKCPTCGKPAQVKTKLSGM